MQQELRSSEGAHMDFYKPFAERTPDSQYIDRLAQILALGEPVKDTPQGVGALTLFGMLPPMVFDLSNGVPLITERRIGFWKKPIAEIIAFVNGARTVDEIESYGCDFWKDYRGKGTGIGLEADDMGPGSYGPAFHDFETPTGGSLNQFEQLIEQIMSYPQMRTHLVTPWKPYYTARGPMRKVIVAPCHGWLHFRVMNGTLNMRMDQRSADMPIGVPSNMIQYAALLLMVCQVTGFRPGKFIHSFADAHIYENQVDAVRELVTRQSRPFPALRLDSSVRNLFDFRIEHFTLHEYDPHPPLAVPYSP
jgi:thymidylate synthase